MVLRDADNPKKKAINLEAIAHGWKGIRRTVCPPFYIKKIGKMLQKQELNEGILQEKNSLKLISDNPVVPVRI